VFSASPATLAPVVSSALSGAEAGGGDAAVCQACPPDAGGAGSRKTVMDRASRPRIQKSMASQPLTGSVAAEANGDTV
jgi:hypothetical protein